MDIVWSDGAGARGDQEDSMDFVESDTQFNMSSPLYAQCLDPQEQVDTFSVWDMIFPNAEQLFLNFQTK